MNEVVRMSSRYTRLPADECCEEQECRTGSVPQFQQCAENKFRIGSERTESGSKSVIGF